MCGISGIFSFSGQVNKERLANFNNALTHRGPDAQNVYISTSGFLGLGHCRLSIVDTHEHANQPFLSNDKRYSLVFNGEIYNYLELRADLERLGHYFYTQSDTEVLLAAYIEWGENCLQKFNGMWAFAIWDDLKQKLFLSRDRFGVKSLYYKEYEGEVSFASEQKAFKHLDGSITFDLNNVNNALIFPQSVEAHRETIYSNIKKLLPGEFAVVEQNHLRISKWWDTYESVFQVEETVNADLLTDLFEDACRIRTRTDVKLATSLSGGLDSSAVTSQLACFKDVRVEKQLKAFIGSFPGTQQDEFKWGKAVVDHHQLPYNRVNIETDNLIDILFKSTIALEDMNSLPAIGQWLIYESMNKEGYKVSLEGHAGDEILGGYYPYFQAYISDLINERSDINALASAIPMMGQIPNCNAKVIRENLLKVSESYLSSNKKLTKRQALYRRYISNISALQTEIVKEKTYDTYMNNSQLFQRLFEDFHYFSLPNILKNYDRLSMAHSVEIRSPFLDYRFVLAAFKAPHQLRIAKGKTKVLIRDHFKFIPEPVRNRVDKSGFTPPIFHWLENELGYWLKDWIHQKDFLESGLFDGQLLSRDIHTFIKQKNWKAIVSLWPLINLSILESA
ncbi:asparagine synthase [Catenovulum agarivorans DS-2]|uniref:asparagine synthase (glutamine-hydrolyzing) n=1 Tax=Catenovulum agarivorans DS-2 TaxID=1328313 RepID=W7QNK4_9ALTE|nr:asparagine synthase (glutamine-hydrolyzing) [Catenovulum agarivorans]EWH09493.1 asparagine synthase [Catenovulum agarivorans DS-2]